MNAWTACIVELQDGTLSREEDVVRIAADSKYGLDEMRQAIMSKALHTGLGANNPDESSLKELLASIMSGNAGKDKSRGE